LAAADTGVLADRIEVCLDLLRPLIRAHYDDASLRLDDLDRIGQAAAASSNLDAFLAGLVLDPAGASADFARSPQLDDDYLILSIVHSAKGLEWDNVHLIHAAHGAFPSDMALSEPDGLAEEARLFYVAITRARNQLTIYHPQTGAPKRPRRSARLHPAQPVPRRPRLRNDRYLARDARNHDLGRTCAGHSAHCDSGDGRTFLLRSRRRVRRRGSSARSSPPAAACRPRPTSSPDD
jgi:hypothetical protein